jgi:ketosteroid isomerase-like protein
MFAGGVRVDVGGKSDIDNLRRDTKGSQPPTVALDTVGARRPAIARTLFGRPSTFEHAYFGGGSMRLLAVLPLFVSLGALPAQRDAAQPSPVAQQLMRNEDGWTAALVKRDASYFQRMLAPKFVYTEDAKVMTRDEVLHEATAGTDTVTAAHNESMIVHEAGPATAVVTGILVVEGRSSGARFVHRYRYTDTWVKQSNGQWQIVAAQDYLIPAG